MYLFSSLSLSFLFLSSIDDSVGGGIRGEMAMDWVQCFRAMSDSYSFFLSFFGSISLSLYPLLFPMSDGLEDRERERH